MMEVDMQSPSSSLRPTYGSMKRARSPDEPNSSSRPSKRLTLATDDEYHPQPIYLKNSSSAGSSRQASEDWVQQAGSLTIDSPLCTRAPPFDDYAMSTDQTTKTIKQNPSNTAPVPAMYGRPQLPPLQTSFSRPSDDHQNHAAAAHPLPQAATVNNPHHQHLAPSINVLPPTPDATFPLSFSSTTRPSTPKNDSPMSMSNSPSSATILSPSRKHRFAMGPRADCEKCRQGVKGHYIHIG
ncbi:hypothetical protein J3R30DRAFT_3695694 [Lentinula aciculospora]|uniref:Uncharacterized protein n=1 Tax=Lentinula aciculospora TaxID=153920 RepID=A0A9W9AQ84_9AGAR|nr:hypothetical protein J3R30DRAFT_3695694 [Lentinula aciculospora]